jgi:hypothetical protein
VYGGGWSGAGGGGGGGEARGGGGGAGGGFDQSFAYTDMGGGGGGAGGLSYADARMSNTSVGGLSSASDASGWVMVEYDSFSPLGPLFKNVFKGLQPTPGSFAPVPGRGGSISRACTRGTRIKYRSVRGIHTTFTVFRLQGSSWITKGIFTHRDRAENTLRFTGRINGRPLSPGHYELLAIGRYHHKLANAVATGFNIVRC